jgi:hypothetical protein
MFTEWLKTEHNRLHMVEEWPDGPHKEASLRAIRSTLASLARKIQPDMALLCETCLNRPASAMIEFPLESNLDANQLTQLAA